MIEEYCIYNDITDEVEENATAETAEVLKLKLEFEREEQRLVREEAQRAHKAAEAEAQKARDVRLAELREARELRQLELKVEAKEEAAVHEHELKMAGLGRHPPLDRASAFDPARNIRLVPPFQEKKVAHFEKVADRSNWPKDSWVLLLQSVLVGKAQEIYGSLSVEQVLVMKMLKRQSLKLTS